jgi:nitrate/nitrite-specific signal transduction histidine kinase
MLSPLDYAVETDVHDLVAQERMLLASEIHDCIAQSLTSIRMRTTLLRDAIAREDGERAAKLAADIDAAVTGVQASVRGIITQFRAAMQGQGLGQALQSTVEEMRQTSGIDVDFTYLVRELRLSPADEQQVFFIAREALTNAVKYSRAECVGMLLIDHGAMLELMVTDNGIGLDCCKPAEEPGHFGLSIMRERARRLGGRVEFETCAVGGTRVRLFVPHPARAPGEPA